MNHRWEYCSLCERNMVICGHCGNNCCNGGSGATGIGDCVDRCDSAYALQARGQSLKKGRGQRRNRRNKR